MREWRGARVRENMSEERNDISSEDTDLGIEEGAEQIASVSDEPTLELAEGLSEEPKPPSLSLGDSIRRATALTARPIRESLAWVVGGKARISIAVGVFAAFIVAIGFTTFDLRHERWMLEQRYPEAVSLDDRYMLYARDLIDHARYAKAQQILTDLIQRQRPAGLQADALFYFGKCLAKSARDPLTERSARQACETFIEEFSTDPRVPDAHRLIADSLAKSELYSDSTMRYRKILRIEKDEARRREIEFLIARNHYAAENVPAATIALKKIRQKYPNTAVARDAALLLARAFVKYRRADEAEKILDGLLEEVPSSPHSAAALGLLAKIAADAGDYDGAIGHCLAWFKDSPSAHNQVEIMLILALARLETGSPEATLALAADIAASFPRSPRLAEAVVLRGRAHEALGEPGGAENSYFEAVDLAPDTSAPHENLARLYRSTGRLGEALEQIGLAASVEPNKDSLQLELAKLYRLNDNNESAIAILRAFTYERQLSLRINEAFLTLADVQAESGAPDEAYRTLERFGAVATSKEDSGAVFEKQGDILAAVGLHEDAIEKYRLAIENDATRRTVGLKIARGFIGAGNPRQCLKELASIEPESQSPDMAFDRLELEARALIDLENYTEARRAIRDAVALRSGREKFSTLASLMQANLSLEDEEAASEIFELTLRLIETDDPSIEAPPDSRRIILDWAAWMYEKGRYDRAAEVYSRIGKLRFPVADAAWVLYQQGNCYYHMDEYAKANEIYARLASEFSESEWVKFAAARKELMTIEAGI